MFATPSSSPSSSLISSDCLMADSCSTSFSSPPVSPSTSHPSFRYSLLSRNGPCLVSHWLNAHFFDDGSQAGDLTPPGRLIVEYGDVLRDPHAERGYTQRPLDFFPLPGTAPQPRIKTTDDDVDFWDSVSAVSYRRLHARARRDLRELAKERKEKEAARDEINDEENASDDEENDFLVRLNDTTALLVVPFGDQPQYRTISFPPTEHQRAAMRALWGERPARHLFESKQGFDYACTFFAYKGCSYRRWLLILYAYCRVRQERHRVAATKMRAEQTTVHSGSSNPSNEICAQSRKRNCDAENPGYQSEHVKRQCVQ